MPYRQIRKPLSKHARALCFELVVDLAVRETEAGEGGDGAREGGEVGDETVDPVSQFGGRLRKLGPGPNVEPEVFCFLEGYRSIVLVGSLGRLDALENRAELGGIEGFVGAKERSCVFCFFEGIATSSSCGLFSALLDWRDMLGGEGTGEFAGDSDVILLLFLCRAI